MQNYVLVAIGGALGAMARYGAGVGLARIWSQAFPLGTMVINIVGSVLMGMFMGAMARHMPSWSETARLFVAVGVLGGFTTFSSFSLETIALIERGEVVLAGAYVLLSVVICLIGLYLGLLVTRGSLA